jgi:type IV pilus assembly protein PilO
MKLRVSRRDTIILVVGVLLLVVLIFYAQFGSLSPLKTDLAGKQQTLQNEQNLLQIASQKNQADLNITTEDTRELQKKLPVKPLEDQFILDLEKAELVSNSQIKSMGFSKDADVTTASTDQNAQNANSQQSTTNQQTTNTQQTSNSTNQATATQNGSATATQASGLKKLTATLTVESPNYADFEKFIQTLESLQRIVVVESISYSGGAEVTSLTEETKPLDFSITVSTFYMPTLTDLASQLPKIDVPAPAGKTNPLSQFSSVNP